MPFVTEEIWEHLRSKIDYSLLIDSPAIMSAKYPVYNPDLVNEVIEKDFGLLKDIITALRTINRKTIFLLTKKPLR